MAPGIVRVELQTMPLPLPEVYLQTVIVRVSFRHQIQGSATCCERIRLQEIDRQSRAHSRVAEVIRAGPERLAHQIAEVWGGSGAREAPSDRSSFSHLDHSRKIEV